ncbi:MAG: hypothetical protein EOO77_12445 [Oxalobacteraceae bacterium]|nr:MAG: hypothetical protein EOO77_12445 [Oxalobacteraceae bacterium]
MRSRAPGVAIVIEIGSRIAKVVPVRELCWSQAPPSISDGIWSGQDHDVGRATRRAEQLVGTAQNAYNSLPCRHLARSVSLERPANSQSARTPLDRCQKRPRSFPPRYGYLLPKLDQIKNIEFVFG